MLSRELPRQNSFLQRTWQSFLTLWWFKAIGITAFMSLFFMVYLDLLKDPVGQVSLVPRLALDEWIGFHPLALIPYLSLWVYVSLPPVFLLTVRDNLAYGIRIGAMCVAGLLIFRFWPTAVPPSDIDWAQHAGMSFLKSVDAAGNACPSLHVATALFSAVWLHRLLRRFDAPPVLLPCNALWCAAIIWSTVATRQHVVLDVLAGILLALCFVLIPTFRER